MPKMAEGFQTVAIIKPYYETLTDSPSLPFSPVSPLSPLGPAAPWKKIKQKQSWLCFPKLVQKVGREPCKREDKGTCSKIDRFSVGVLESLTINILQS